MADKVRNQEAYQNMKIGKLIGENGRKLKVQFFNFIWVITMILPQDKFAKHFIKMLLHLLNTC